MTDPNALSDEDVLRTKNDREMMRRPHLWPTADAETPSLMLWRPTTKEEEPAFYAVGILFALPKEEMAEGEEFYAFVADGQDPHRHGVSGGEGLVSLLVDAGWVVD